MRVALAVKAAIGTLGKRSRRIPQLAVFRTELVAPFRNAVGFIDREERQRHLLQPAQHVLLHDAFGRYIQQLQRARFRLTPHLARAFVIERAVEKRRVHADLAHAGGLVLHQGDQRAHHYCGAPQNDRGKLVA